MKNRGRGLLLPIEFRVLTADRRSVAIFPLSLSLPLPFPSLPFSLSFFSLLNPGPSDFFFFEKVSRGTKEEGEGVRGAPSRSPLPLPSLPAI